MGRGFALRVGVAAVLAAAGGLPAGELDVVINEVLYHPPAQAIAGLEDAEFIELHNRGDAAVDLSGWTVSGAVELTIAAGTILPPGGYLVLARSAPFAAGLYPGVRIAGGWSGRLSDSGERIRLATRAGVLVETFSYRDADGWPEKPDGGGASLERISPAAPADFADSWRASLTLLGTPGRLNSQYRELVDRALVALGDSWKYAKGLAEPSPDPAGWASPAFDDSSWLAGPAGIGYGDLDDQTVLDDMAGLYSTVYLRRGFQVPDPGSLVALTLTIDYDDGFVAYLNGVEVTRRNAPGAPGTPVPFDALAVLSREAGAPETIDLGGSRGLLVPGRNVLAIQVLNQPLGSTDLSLLPALSGREEVLGTDLSLNRLSTIQVIARRNLWRYAKGTAEPALPLGSWALPGFDDAPFSEGPSGFGYADNDDDTVLADMLNGYTTLYLRKRFTISGAADVVGMTLGVDYDDGFVAYLNGEEVARRGVTGAAGVPVPYTANANQSHEAGAEETIDLTARVGLLLEGENVLAVQGLNQSAGSTDFSLAPTLRITRSVAGDPRALAGGIHLNEVHAPGGGAGYVEVRNGLDEEVDLSGFGLSGDLRFPALYLFPPGTRLAAGGFLAVAEADLGFPLAPAGALLLTDGAGVVLIDGREYALPAGTDSAGAFPDGHRGDFAVLSAPTPGEPNAAPPDRGVVLNEIMYHPAGAPNAPELEWVEIHNRSESAVSLAGWAFTRGLDFAFPSTAAIPAGGYLVVASDPAGVEARYGISGVLGGFSGRLRNDDETVQLRDDLGNVADRVHYADDGRWPPAADGAGPSAELVNPRLDNSGGQAWAASDGQGTPGAPNSRYDPSPPPLVSRLRHDPPVPRSTDPVAVTAEIGGLLEVAEVRLFHRRDGDAEFSVGAMLDDGLHRDGAAFDGVFGAVLPERPAGAIVEFFLEAEDAGGRIRVVPAPAPAANALYQVVDAPAAGDLPLYRIILTGARLAELQSRDVQSDVLLDATFVAGQRIDYNVGLRYRGESARPVTPKSYRVDFPDDEEFEGQAHLDLHGHRPWTRHLALGVFRGAEVPAPLSRPVEVSVNGSAPLAYARIEAVGEDFLRRFYREPAGEDDGNLYRGVDDADLAWRGPDQEAYRASYRKETHLDRDDYSDLIDLCDRFSNTPDGSFATAIRAVIDTGEWARFFAAHAAVSTQEGGIALDRGDDYYLYRRPSDGRFVLIPWDEDAGLADPNQQLLRPSLATIRRFLLHPEFTPLYYAALLALEASHASPARIADAVARLEGVYPAPELAAISAFSAARAATVAAGVPVDLTARPEARYLVHAAEPWRFFRGADEPSAGTLAWTQPGFDDGAWEEGPGGFGYGDGDDATVLADMPGSYSTVYLRRTFQVADPGAVASLEISVDFDDGFAAWLNGVEVARANAGAPGSFLSHTALATASREAGAAQSFTIPDAGALLVAGENVLALVGLNLDLTSTDFSLRPDLRTGGVVAEGCPGEHFVTGEDLLLSGLAPVAETRAVRVNGLDASYDHLSGVWSRSLSLARGTQTATVQALGLSGAVVATETLKLTRVTTVGGTVGGSQAWPAAGSPYLVVSAVDVPAGSSLSIGAGSVFLVGEGMGFSIAGELRALGTAAAPITFDPMPCHENWGHFSFNSTSQPNRLESVKLNHATGSPGAVVVSGSTLTIDGCHIHDIDGEGVSAVSSTIDVFNTLVERTKEALSLDFCRTVVEFNVLRNAIGSSDLCDANGSNNPPARIAFNTMQGTSDDAIDADRGSVYAEGNVLRNCGDQGISLVGAGNSTVYRNVLFRNNVGLSVKDRHRVIADHNTMAFNTSIGVRAIEKNAGLGGGIIDLRNSIVWGSPTSLFINSTGEITAAYCDVQGVAPPGTGNLSVDPLFVNPAANDFRLQASSPLIGAAGDGDDIGALPYETTPRAPTQLRVTGTTFDSVSLAWIENSFVETAVEVHRRVSFAFSPVYLAAEGQVARFFRGRAEPSGGTLDWTARGFPDGSWEEGPLGIGYGDGDDATVLGDMQNGYTTVYLRIPFAVADPSATTALELVVDYDDGFVAFLNGREVARRSAGEAGAFLPFNALGSLDHEAGTPEVIEVPVAGLLVPGTNVLAVQGLNIARASTDFTLLPELRTVDEGPFELRAVLPPSRRTHTDAGLGPSATYSYRVRAVNAQGPSSFSNTASVKTGTIPPAPADLRVVSFTGSAISLAWNDRSDSETSFELERALGEGEFAPAASLPPNTATHVDSGLDAGGTYHYRVRAVNGFGPSDWSNPVSQTTGDPPAAPSDLVVASVTLTSVSLTFTDNSDDETGFEVEVRLGAGQFQPRASLPAGVTAYTDGELLSGQTYFYRVRAVSLLGASDYSNVVEAVIPSLPAVPGDLTVSGVGLSTVSLTWIDAAANEYGYQVERRRPGDADFTLLADLPAGSTEFADTGLASGAAYSYRVRAVNEHGPSPWSREVTATTGTLPGEPRGLSVTSVGLFSVGLRWGDLSSDEVLFQLERAEGAAAFSLLLELPAGTIEFLDEGLEAGTTYRWRVRAVNGFGPSDWSNEVEATTGSLPEAPGGLRVSAVGHDSIALEWIDRSADEESFEVERRQGNGPFAPAGSVAEGLTAFLDAGLLEGTLYGYRVRAVNRFGPSGWSAVVEAVTGRLPARPDGLRVAEVFPDALRLSFRDNSEDETGFEVERRPAGGGVFELLATLAAGTTSFLDAGLPSGARFVYRVRAVNGFGESAYSEEVEGAAGAPPAIASLSPQRGPVAGGTALVVTGANFLPDTLVTLGGAPLSELTVVGLGEIRGIAPPHPAGAVDLRVENSQGSAVLAGAFTYFDAPLRGDVNVDGTLDISDPTALLGTLFLGFDPPPCDDLADVNSDLTVDLSDAIALLNYLFTGGRAPFPETACET